MNTLESFNRLTAMPAVAFDVRLGRTTEYIDFDYAAYDTYIREKGLTDEQIDATTIQFNALKAVRMVGGYYERGTNNPQVGVSSDDTEVALNQRFLHENEHLVSDVTGLITPQIEHQKRRTNLLRATSVAAGITCIVAEGYAIAAEREELVLLGGGLALLSIATGIGRILSYAADKDECRAREAEVAPSAPSLVSYVGKNTPGPAEQYRMSTLTIPLPGNSVARLRYLNPFKKP